LICAGEIHLMMMGFQSAERKAVMCYGWHSLGKEKNTCTLEADLSLLANFKFLI
jgi:hypothetical protein